MDYSGIFPSRRLISLSVTFFYVSYYFIDLFIHQLTVNFDFWLVVFILLISDNMKSQISYKTE